MSKKIKLTSRGKIVISVISAILVIAISVTGFSVFKSNSTPDYAEEVYGYAISHILEQSIINEQNSRAELRQNIEDANKLVKETDGKIFDASRANLQTYLDNISGIPDSKITESTNFIDYVKSEKNVRTYIGTLDEKQKALQEDYDTWTKSRSEFEESTGTIQKELEGGIEDVSNLEQQIQENLTEQEKRAKELEKQIQEKKKSEERNKPTPSISQPNIPTQNPTSQPSTPSKPTPTEKPKPTNPTTTPEKPSVEPNPKPTDTPKPSSPPEDAEENETNANGNTTMIGQGNG